MGIIWLLLKESWLNVTLAILAGLISGGCSARLIALINVALEQGATQSLIWAFAGLALVSLLTGSFSQFLLIDLAQGAVYQLRLRLSQRILSAPLKQLEQLGPSQLLPVLTKDVQAISDTVFILPFICIDFAIIGGCLIYLGWLSGWVFLAVIVLLGVAIALVQSLLNYAHRYIYQARQEVDRLFSHFRGITDGIKELKLNSARRQTFFEADLTVSAAASRQYQSKAMKFGTVAMSGGQFLFFGLVAVLLFAIPQVVTISQTVLSAFIITLTYLLGPLDRLVQRLPFLLNANVSIQKVNDMGLMLASDSELDTVIRQPCQSNWQHISLQQVKHTYAAEDTEHPFTFGPIDLTVKAGEVVFIVGGNGSGKSTLAKLITGLYVPDSGQLCFDGEPIVDSNREWYRQHFSAIFADYYLFKRLESAESSDLFAKTAQYYLQQLELDQKVTIQDGQLSTTALSQGQRKRLALLSAYLEDRPIYLFDEWAADQDPIFREIFYHQLLADLKRRGKTVIAITHDDHFFHLADRVIKLDYGQLAI